jgi:hypothetical protein
MQVSFLVLVHCVHLYLCCYYHCIVIIYYYSVRTCALSLLNYWHEIAKFPTVSMLVIFDVYIQSNPVITTSVYTAPRI